MSFHAYSVRGRHVESRRKRSLYLIIMSFHIETCDEINCNFNLTVNNICFAAKLSSVSNMLFVMNTLTVFCKQNITIRCRGSCRLLVTAFHAYYEMGRHVESRRGKATGLYLIIMSFHRETNDKINCNYNVTVTIICFAAKQSSGSNM